MSLVLPHTASPFHIAYVKRSINTWRTCQKRLKPTSSFNFYIDGPGVIQWTSMRTLKLKPCLANTHGVNLNKQVVLLT